MKTESKEEKKTPSAFQQMLYVVFHALIVPALFAFFMWAFTIVGVFLIIGDLWRAAGIVSAFTLVYIIRAEFYKEFYGNRHGIQEQTQRD